MLAMSCDVTWQDLWRFKNESFDLGRSKSMPCVYWVLFLKGCIYTIWINCGADWLCKLDVELLWDNVKQTPIIRVLDWIKAAGHEQVISRFSGWQDLFWKTSGPLFECVNDPCPFFFFLLLYIYVVFDLFIIFNTVTLTINTGFNVYLTIQIYGGSYGWMDVKN